MNNDLNASEKRLIAALDRLDGFIDRMAVTRAAAGSAPEGDPRPENRDISDDLSMLVDEQAEQLAELEARLVATDERLNAAGDEIARLAAANEALASANRELIASQPDSPSDEIRRALQAEIDSLRATRVAEAGQMAEIADTLDRMLGEAPPRQQAEAPAAEPAGAPAVVETPMPLDVSANPPEDLDLGGDADADRREAEPATDENRG